MRKSLLALTLAASLLAGWASPAPAHEALGTNELAGSGTTLGHPIVARWARSYRRAGGVVHDMRPAGSGLDDAQVGPPLSYEPVGSLAGIMRVTAGAVDFGASDVPLPSAELARLHLMQFPVVIGGIVAAVNLDGVPPGALKLSGPLLADIYLGKVSAWSDPAIKALNPDLRLPDLPIQVIRRSDGSGTTFAFTGFLARESAEWRTRIGADLRVTWPVGSVARGNEGMARAVQRTKNSIGYIDFAHARQARLSYAALRNTAGRFILPDAAGFQAAATTVTWSAANDFAQMLGDTPNPLAYPIVATVFVLMPRTAKGEHDRATLQFFHWALENGGRDATELGYVPLPATLVGQIKDYWKQGPQGR